MHHNACFNLFMHHNNSFDNQGSEINKNDIFCISTYSLSRKRSSYYTLNKVKSCYRSSCIRLCSQVTLGILVIYALNP